MDADRGIIRISVRNLVEFVMRSGDIDNRRTSAAEKEAACTGRSRNVRARITTLRCR